MVVTLGPLPGIEYLSVAAADIERIDQTRLQRRVGEDVARVLPGAAVVDRL